MSKSDICQSRSLYIRDCNIVLIFLCVFFSPHICRFVFHVGYSMSLIGCCWFCKIYHILCYAEIIK